MLNRFESAVETARAFAISKRVLDKMPLAFNFQFDDRDSNAARD